jgi:trans-aconitate methyltransferase
MSEPQPKRPVDWNANLYDAKHGFVWQFGADLLPLLAPQRGERILDIGCGTGHLTAQIAESGAKVLGVDRSPEMAGAARKAYSHLQFEVADARSLPYRAEFDAVFSNATLHWILEPDLVVRNVWNALRPGGRFVGEFGGRGNVAKMMSAFDQAIAVIQPGRQNEIKPWYYASVSEYATLLENNGFEVRFMTLFDRPTPLADGQAGMRNWITMFGSHYIGGLDSAALQAFFARVEDLLRPELFREGQWWADYRRLRFAAWK